MLYYINILVYYTYLHKNVIKNRITKINGGDN